MDQVLHLFAADFIVIIRLNLTLRQEVGSIHREKTFLGSRFFRQIILDSLGCGEGPGVIEHFRKQGGQSFAGVQPCKIHVDVPAKYAIVSFTSQKRPSCREPLSS
ncbi:MAG: hypothetical protein AB2404_09085, partial [Planifilum fimeticola]